MFVGVFFVVLLVYCQPKIGVRVLGAQTLVDKVYDAYYKEIEEKLESFEYKSTKPFNGTIPTPIGDFFFTAQNVDISGLGLKSLQLEIIDKYFSFKLTGVTAKASFDYDIKEKVWPHKEYSGHGSADCDVDVSFLVMPFVGANYVMQVDISNVALEFTSFDINLTGIPSWLEKIMKYLKSSIEKAIESQVEEKIPTIIDTLLNKKLTDIGNTVTLSNIPYVNDLGVNISMANFELTNGTMRVENLAEFVTVGKPEPPFPDTPVPMIGRPFTSDFELDLSEFTINSGLFSAHYAGMIQFFVDKDTIPEEYAEKLNTLYFKDAIPILYQDYPNKPLYVSCSSSIPPRLDVKLIPAFSLDLDCAYFIGELPPMKNDEPLFTLGIHSKFNWTFSIDEQASSLHFTAYMQEYNLTLAKVGSIGSFDPSAIEALLGNDFRKFVLPYVNSFGEKGFKLCFPKIGLDLVSPKIYNFQEYFVGFSNVKITPIPIPKVVFRNLFGILVDDRVVF